MRAASFAAAEPSAFARCTSDQLGYSGSSARAGGATRVALIGAEGDGADDAQGAVPAAPRDVSPQG